MKQLINILFVTLFIFKPAFGSGGSFINICDGEATVSKNSSAGSITITKGGSTPSGSTTVGTYPVNCSSSSPSGNLCENETCSSNSTPGATTPSGTTCSANVSCSSCTAQGGTFGNSCSYTVSATWTCNGNTASGITKNGSNLHCS